MAATIRVIEQKPNQDVIDLLEQHLERARRGDITRLGVIYELKGDEGWGTAFSSSDSRREDVAMLIELAMRRLGFVSE